MSKENSGKRQAILAGVVTLLESGQSLHTMKVADIAAAAGVGKGTVYEYFGTKEEVISRAVVDHLCNIVAKVGERVEEAPSFREKLFVLLEQVHAICGNMAGLDDLLGGATPREMGDMMHNAGVEFAADTLLDPLYVTLLRSGREEGVITCGDPPYQRLVLRSILFGYIISIRQQSDTQEVSEKTLWRMYRMAERSLGSD